MDTSQYKYRHYEILPVQQLSETQKIHREGFCRKENPVKISKKFLCIRFFDMEEGWGNTPLLHACTSYADSHCLKCTKIKRKSLNAEVHKGEFKQQIISF